MTGLLSGNGKQQCSGDSDWWGRKKEREPGPRQRNKKDERDGWKSVFEYVLITISFCPPLLSPSLVLILYLAVSLSLSPFSLQEKNKDKDKRFRPIYDIPYMFEAREFMRKKIIGKKVREPRPQVPLT